MGVFFLFQSKNFILGGNFYIQFGKLQIFSFSFKIKIFANLPQSKILKFTDLDIVETTQMEFLH